MYKYTRGQAMTEYIVIISAVAITTLPLMMKYGNSISKKTMEAASVIAGNTDLNGKLNRSFDSLPGKEDSVKLPNLEQPDRSNIPDEIVDTLTDPKAVVQLYQKKYGDLAMEVLEGAILGFSMDTLKELGMDPQDLKRLYTIGKGYRAATKLPANVAKSLAELDLSGLVEAGYDVVKPIGDLAYEGYQLLTKIPGELKSIDILTKFKYGKVSTEYEKLPPRQQQQFDLIYEKARKGEISRRLAIQLGAKVIAEG